MNQFNLVTYSSMKSNNNVNILFVLRYSGTNLMYVIAHEIGHSLGLYHSTHEDSIMKPSYEDYVLDDGKLPITDARAIQKLYGKCGR